MQQSSLPSLMSAIAWRLLPLSLLALASACGGCGDDDENADTPDMSVAQPDMREPDLGEPDMEPEPEPDLGVPDMVVVEPDLGEPDMEEPLRDGPEVTPLSFTVYPPQPVSCDAPGTRYRIPVAVIAEEREGGKRRALRPYDRIGGRPLVINDTVNVGAVAAERMRIAEESSLSCDSSADCQSGFTCSTGGDRDASRVCVRASSLTFIPDSLRVDFDPGDTGKNQIYGILYENSGGLDGYTALDVGSLFDENGEKDLFNDDDRATDGDLSTRVAARELATFLASYVSDENTAMAAWWFAGTIPAETVPITRADRPMDRFVSDLTDPVNKFESLPNPSARLATGNVYQAIMRVIERDYSLPQYAEHEKFLFVIVDGPNEVWDANATKERVMEALEAHNVHIFFLHFDTAIDASKVRDPLAYWSGSAACRNDAACRKAPPCAADSDCQSFEECRRVTLYSETAGTAPTQSDVPYCLPKYREDGRLGPNNIYADMACRSGGNYLYFTNARGMEPALKELGPVLDGQWSLEADISALNADRLAQGFYRLSGIFLGLFGNASLGAKLSSDIYGPCFNDPTAECLNVPDNRPLLRLGNITSND